MTGAVVLMVYEAHGHTLVEEFTSLGRCPFAQL